MTMLFMRIHNCLHGASHVTLSDFEIYFDKRYKNNALAIKIYPTCSLI